MVRHLLGLSLVDCRVAGEDLQAAVGLVVDHLWTCRPHGCLRKEYLIRCCLPLVLSTSVLCLSRLVGNVNGSA